MPDDVDRSVDEQDFNLQLAPARQRVTAAAMRQAMPAIGICYNCRDPVGPGQLYCDKDCEADDVKRRRDRQ